MVLQKIEQKLPKLKLNHMISNAIKSLHRVVKVSALERSGHFNYIPKGEAACIAFDLRSQRIQTAIAILQIMILISVPVSEASAERARSKHKPIITPVQTRSTPALLTSRF
jgi:hypothetical protein